MATLRDLVPGYAPTDIGALTAAPLTAAPTLRYGPEVAAQNDALAAGEMGQLRRGFASGRLGVDANALRAEQAGLRADGREAEAAALDPRVQALRGRAATFAPAEQDVTALDWNPGRIVDWGLGAVGQAGASMLDPVALGAAANVAGTVVGAIPHPLAKLAGGALRLGGMAGGYGLNAQQAKGEFVEDAYNDPALMARTTPQALNTAANISGGVSGALDSVLTTGVAGRLAGRPTVKALAGLGMPAKVGLDVAGEGLTEVAQGEVKRGTLGFLNPERDTSGDASDRWNDFAGGLAGAAPISAASHYAAAGHRRLGVEDDTSSNDVSGKTKLIPTKENFSERLVRGAKAQADEDAAEAWNGVLASGDPSVDLDAPDGMERAATTRHDALLKELSGRVEKGDAVAKQHLDTLSAMDPADPIGWLDSTARGAAYKHILGDGTDHAEVVKAYENRKQNRQGAKSTPEAELAASILQGALPEARGVDAATWKTSAPMAASDLGQTLADLAQRKGKIGANDIDRVLTTAGRMVNAYSLDGARSAVARVAMALGAEKTPAFQMLQQHLSAADKVQLKNNERKSRLEVADTLAKTIPTEARLALLKEGADLTEPSVRRALLDLVQEVAQKTGYGAVNPATGEPIVVKPSAYANLTARLGPNGAAVAKKLLDMVAPGKVEEKEGAGEKKASGGGKTGATGIGSDDAVELKPAVAGDDADETSGRELDNALRGIDKAPGSKLYVFNKRHHPVSSTKPGEHPFVIDKKTKTLPSLATAEQADESTGFKTLERMAEQLYTKLGGDPFTPTVTKAQRGAAEKDQYGMARQRIVRENLKQNDIKNDDPKAAVSAFGIGSYRIRTVSAKEVMDDREVPEPSRVRLMVDYLHQDGVADKNLGLIKRMAILDRQIKVADNAQRKSALEEERRTIIASVAQSVGMKDFDGSTTLGDVANAYFGDRFLVTAEQMAEKDQLRLDLAEVVRMIRRGKDYLDYTDQFGEDKAKVQADMNLIRFKSDSAVAKDGIAVVPAGDLVAWVFSNRNDYEKKDGDAEVRAREYRDALMEGIGALAADGHMAELPYMLNAEGKKEMFGGGIAPAGKVTPRTRGTFPPSLKLGRMTQADLTKTAKQRVAELTAQLKEARTQEEARGPEERAKAAERVERARQMRVARDQDKSEDVKNTDPTELLDEGREAPRLSRLDENDDRLPSDGTRYWDAPGPTTSQEARLAAINANADAVRNPEIDPFTGKAKGPKVRRVSGTATAPETVETRRNTEDRTQLDWDMVEDPDAVPTDFVDVRNATSVLSSALDKTETLTPTNAAAKGRLLAEKLWGQFRDGRARAIEGLQRLVAATERPLEPTGGGYAGGAHYAVPTALLLTPARVKSLVATSQGPEKAQRLLDGLRSRTAVAILAAEDVLPLHQRVPLARALLGTEKLTGATMKAPLEALAKPAREAAAAKQKADAATAAAQAKKVADVQQKRSATPMTAKTETAASRVDARVMKEDYNLRVEQVRPFLLAAQARLAQLEQMRRDNDQENLPAAQETVLRRLRELFGPNSDLTVFYTEASGFAGMNPADRQQAISFAEGLTAPVDSGIRKNSMAVKIHTDLERGGFAATHDSPIKHEGKFDWRKHIGKGEGNAVYGAGTYLSTSDGVHRSYKEQFSAQTRSEESMSWSIDGLSGELFQDSVYGDTFDGDELNLGQQMVLSKIAEGKKPGEAKLAAAAEANAFLQKQADDLIFAYGERIPSAVESQLIQRQALTEGAAAALAEAGIKISVARWNKNVESTAKVRAQIQAVDLKTIKVSRPFASPTYEVSVDIGEHELLNWNVKLSSQDSIVAEKVKDALESAGIRTQRQAESEDGEQTRPDTEGDTPGDDFDISDDATGEAVYKVLTARLGSQAKASNALQAAGVLGHQYASSGGKNDKHPNVVIYDDSKITTNYVHFNAQATAARDTGVYSDAEVAKAKAHFAKVLGPKITVLASETFPDAGEWNDAEQTARLSTAIGPGVLSVAYHESMHGLWSRLIKNSPNAAKVLAKAASDPRMLERLQGMLGNEPAALAQIADGTPHSQEERVAYMYQFWAAGLLDVDKPATTLFAKMRKMLRKVLGMVRESETALELMTAFHDGKLAEPSAAGRVIDKIMKAQTWNEDVKRKFDKQVQGVFAAVATSNSVLRNETLSATARKLGMTMFTNPGEATAGRFKRGYINARRQVTAQYTNYLYEAIKGLSGRDMAAVVEELQLQREPTVANLPYAPVRQAVERVHALTQRYWTYATGDAGMKLEFLGKYHYPRVWSLNALIEEGGKDKFIAMLMQPKYAKTMKAATDLANENLSKPFTTQQVAEQMYQHLIDKNGVDETGLEAERASSDLLAPFFASQKERSFKWLDNEDVRPFLEKDLVGAMSRYLHQGVRAAEYVRRFGEGGKDLKELLAMKGDTWVNPETDKKEDRPEHGKIAGEIAASLKEKGVTGKEADEILARHMEDIRNAVEAHEGSLGRDITPTMRKFSSAAMAYQNLRLLPLSLFAAFGDTIGIAGRYGDGGGKLAFQAFLQGLKDVYARWKDAASDVPAERQKNVWENLAEMIGAVDSHMFLEQMGKAHTSEFMTDFARRANRALFMANGLTAWDRSMRVSATKAAVLFLQDHASLPDKTHSKRWLAELGLTDKDIPLDAEGKLITDRHVLAATKGIDIEQATKEMERVHFALTRWVEGAVLTPNAGQRPTWASDPHFAVLFHLKQFTYSFQDTILKRAFNEASHGNMTPIGALAAAVPTMIAADIVKGFVLGGGSLPDYMKAWDAGDWVAHGIQRAGHLGIAQFGIDALNDPTSLAGPTVDQATDWIWNPTEVGKNVLNAIPGARMSGDLKDMVRVVGG